jgi:hypothetical protein
LIPNDEINAVITGPHVAKARHDRPPFPDLMTALPPNDGRNDALRRLRGWGDRMREWQMSSCEQLD